MGGVTEAAHATGITLIACAIGLGVSFASILLIGLAGEEELVVGFTEFIDKLSRASVGMLLALGYACWGVFVVADSVRSVGVSRALVRAARDGAEPQAVPHPAQVESVVLAPHTQLVIFLGVLAPIALAVAGIYLGEHDTGVALAGLLVALASAAGIYAAYKISRPAHRRRRQIIAEHWTAHFEQTAWGHARNASGDRRGQESPADNQGSASARKLSRGGRLLILGFVSGTLSTVVLELFLFVRYPGSVSTPGATLNDRGFFSDGVETVLDGAVWVLVALGLAGLVLAVAGSATMASGLAAERDELEQRLEDPRATRPDGRLLRRHAERRPAGLALVGAGLGAFLLVPSLGVLSLLADDSRAGADTAELFSGLNPFAVTGVVVGIVLIATALVASAVVNVRDYPLRDRLQQRWPVLPRKPEDKKSAKYAVRTKPTLRREDL